MERQPISWSAAKTAQPGEDARRPLMLEKLVHESRAAGNKNLNIKFLNQTFGLALRARPAQKKWSSPELEEHKDLLATLPEKNKRYMSNLLSLLETEYKTKWSVVKPVAGQHPFMLQGIVNDAIENHGLHKTVRGFIRDNFNVQLLQCCELKPLPCKPYKGEAWHGEEVWERNGWGEGVGMYER